MASKANTGSFGSQQGYNKLVSSYGPGTTATVLAPKGPGAPVQPPVSDSAPFVARDALDKVAVLAVLALAAGVGATFLKVSPGIGFLSFLAAFGFYFVGFFKPKAARITAPIYSILIGTGLGVISRSYSTGSTKVIPLAVAATTAVFFGALFLYRTGIVHVGTAFVRATVLAFFGLLIAMVVSLLFNMHASVGHQSFMMILIFGYLYLVVGVMSLFVDLAYLYKAEQAGVTKDGEWFAAQMVMGAMVMIYLALLTIFGGNR